MRYLITSLFLLALLACAAHSQISVAVAPASLNYLVENAGTIVQGNIASVVVEPHPQFANLETVVVTIAVAKTLKGPSGSTLVFRQYVGGTKEFSTSGSYQKAEEVLLFLNPESSYGLTSPVGMEQGLFRVLHDNKGNRYAVNGRGNVGLFREVLNRSASQGITFSTQAKAMLAKTSGQVDLDTFEEAIQTLVGSPR